MKKVIVFSLLFILITLPVQAKINLNVNNLEYEDNYLKFGENTITQDDIEITSNTGEYFEDEKRLILNGSVNLNSDNYIINSETMEGNTDEDIYIFEQNVSIENIDPEQEKFNLKSDYLKLFSDTNNFTAEKSVVIEQKEQTIKAEQVDYEDETEILTLNKQVVVNKDDGTVIRTDSMNVDLKSESTKFNAEGNVDITIDN